MEVVDTVLSWIDEISQLIFPQSDSRLRKDRECVQFECIDLKVVAEWFGQFSLTKGKDVPVVINAHTEFGNELLNKLFESDVFDFFDLSTTKHCFIAGSFNKETNAFEHAVIYTANEISCEFEAIFEGKDIIVLS